MNSQPLHDFAQSDGSGILMLFLAIFVIGVMAVGARFFLGRHTRAHELRAFLSKKESTRNLTAYEQLRIKNFFAREIQTRHLEGYQSKTGDVGHEVFFIEGPVRQHSVTTTRGVIYTYQTISGLEMLVPTAAIPYLQNDHNRVEFVMVGNLACVIKLNEQFEIVSATSESDQAEQSATLLGDLQTERRLDAVGVLEGRDPSNYSLYLKSIKGDRLLVSGYQEFSAGLEFILGIYWVLLFLLCGFAPLALLVIGVLIADLEQALELAHGAFLYIWPFGQLVLLTLPFVIAFWIVRRLMPPRDYVLVLNRQNQQVLFYHQSMKPVSLGWGELYALVETTKWMTAYGWPMREVLLELASSDRDSEMRASVRLKYSTEEEALGAWRAMRGFMNGNLDTLSFSAGKPAGSRGKEQREQAFNLKALARAMVYWLLGGPLSRMVESWVFWQRQQLFWRRVNSAKILTEEKL